MPNYDVNEQVKHAGSGQNTGGWHRAIEVARMLYEAGKWNGQGILTVIDPYDTHRIASYDWLGGVAALKEGTHYRIEK